MRRIQRATGAAPLVQGMLHLACALVCLRFLDPAAGDASRVFATCVDLDAEALLATARRAERSGLHDRMAFLEGNAVPVEGEGVSVRPQHVVYALGLWEYLSDDRAVALLDWAFQCLIEGGAVVVTNLDAANPDRALMEHLLDWKANHRTSDELGDLFTRSRFATRPEIIASEGAGVMHFAQGIKR